MSVFSYPCNMYQDLVANPIVNHVIDLDEEYLLGRVACLRNEYVSCKSNKEKWRAIIPGMKLPVIFADVSKFDTNGKLVEITKPELYAVSKVPYQGASLMQLFDRISYVKPEFVEMVRKNPDNFEMPFHPQTTEGYDRLLSDLYQCYADFPRNDGICFLDMSFHLQILFLMYFPSVLRNQYVHFLNLASMKKTEIGENAKIHVNKFYAFQKKFTERIENSEILYTFEQVKHYIQTKFLLSDHQGNREKIKNALHFITDRRFNCTGTRTARRTYYYILNNKDSNRLHGVIQEYVNQKFGATPNQRKKNKSFTDFTRTVTSSYEKYKQSLNTMSYEPESLPSRNESSSQSNAISSTKQTISYKTVECEKGHNDAIKDSASSKNAREPENKQLFFKVLNYQRQIPTDGIIATEESESAKEVASGPGSSSEKPDIKMSVEEVLTFFNETEKQSAQDNSSTDPPTKVDEVSELLNIWTNNPLNDAVNEAVGLYKRSRKHGSDDTDTPPSKRVYGANPNVDPKNSDFNGNVADGDLTVAPDNAVFNGNVADGDPNVALDNAVLETYFEDLGIYELDLPDPEPDPRLVV